MAVTYLANASVLLSEGGREILIDGPFTAGVRPYPRFEARTLRAVRQADPPFGGLDWILITHAHDDHMDAAAIVDHLRSNPRARVVSTPEAVRRIRDEAEGRAAVTDRVTAVDPPEGRRVVVHDGQPRIEALALHHGRDRDVSNLGFLVELDGVRILHVGDTEATAPDLAPLGLPGLAIDAALLPTWYFTGDSYRPALEELLARKHLVMHFPAPEFDGSFIGRLGGWSGVREFFRAFEPRPTLLTERGAVVCVGEGS